MTPTTITLKRAQQFLLYSGLTIATILLSKFAFDCSGSATALAVALWLLVMSTLAIVIMAVLDQPLSHVNISAFEQPLRLLLLLAIPLGFLAAALDCTGLAARGCTSWCTFIKVIWIPLLALVCLIYYVSQDEAALFVITLLSFVPLVPHCLCYNPANSWWIDHLGASPQCYVWGFTVSLLSCAALRRGARLWLLVLLCYTIIAGALSFFISHHFFRFPW